MQGERQQIPQKMQLPDHLTYKFDQNVKTITLQNVQNNPLVFKIKTNQRSSVSISQSHGFVIQKNDKKITVKLVEPQQGVKLQINYAFATKQMLQADDSKFPSSGPMSIKKQCIQKHVIQIRVDKNKQSSSPLSLNDKFKQLNKKKIFAQDRQTQKQISMLDTMLGSKTSQKELQNDKSKVQSQNVKKKTIIQEKDQKHDIKSPMPQQTQKYFMQAQSQQICLAERPDQQEAEQIEEKIKKSQQEQAKLRKQVQAYRNSQKFATQYNIWMILGCMSITFLLGGALKSFLMQQS